MVNAGPSAAFAAAAAATAAIDVNGAGLPCSVPGWCKWRLREF